VLADHTYDARVALVEDILEGRGAGRADRPAGVSETMLTAVETA
jgi:hypothetical protein